MTSEVCAGCGCPVQVCDCDAPPDDDYDDFDPEHWCHYCGGDGWGITGTDWPVDDPVNDCPGEVEECPNCHGSGLAKDCTFW